VAKFIRKLLSERFKFMMYQGDFNPGKEIKKQIIAQKCLFGFIFR